MGTATIWQIIYLGHKFVMNPESVVDFMKNKNPKIFEAIKWVAENAKKLNLVYTIAKDIKKEN